MSNHPTAAEAGSDQEPDAGPGTQRRVAPRRGPWLQTRLEQLDAVHACEIARLESTIASLEARLRAVEASKTWRVTAPLRHVVARTRVKNPWKRAYRQEASPTPSDDDDYRRWIERYDTIDAGDLEAMAGLSGMLDDEPLISVLMRVSDVPARRAVESIDSVIGQVYPRWELCLALDVPEGTAVHRHVRAYAAREPRVRLTAGSHSDDVATAHNRLLQRASGEWIVLLDPGHRLRPHSLLMVAMELATNPHAEFVYSDEDLLDEQGLRLDPSFKPDWDPLLLLGMNYLGRLASFRRARALTTGGFRSEFADCHDQDLFLRLLQDVPGADARHVRHVLYHSPAGDVPTTMEQGPAGRADELPAAQAVRAHLRARGEQAHVTVETGGVVNVRFALPDPAPDVDVIVPTTARPEVVEPCLDGLLLRTAYPNLRIVLVCSDRDASEPSASRILKRASEDPRVTVLTHPDRGFNWAWANNLACRRSSGSVICFLNDDTSIIHADWLDAMVAQLMRDDVGAVGGMLYYADDTVQHGGVVLGVAGLASHRHVGLKRGATDLNGRALVSQELSAVTGACMVVRREAFESVGGFDETFEIAYNDIDFCLRLGRAGWRIVWTPNAELYHDESTSIGSHDAPGRKAGFDAERQRFHRRWWPLLVMDPFYNPNLSLDTHGALACPPRVRYPWRSGAS